MTINLDSTPSLHRFYLQSTRYELFMEWLLGPTASASARFRRFDKNHDGTIGAGELIEAARVYLDSLPGSKVSKVQCVGHGGLTYISLGMEDGTAQAYGHHNQAVVQDRLDREGSGETHVLGDEYTGSFGTMRLDPDEYLVKVSYTARPDNSCQHSGREHGTDVRFHTQNQIDGERYTAGQASEQAERGDGRVVVFAADHGKHITALCFGNDAGADWSVGVDDGIGEGTGFTWRSVPTSLPLLTGIQQASYIVIYSSYIVIYSNNSRGSSRLVSRITPSTLSGSSPPSLNCPTRGGMQRERGFNSTTSDRRERWSWRVVDPSRRHAGGQTRWTIFGVGTRLF